MVVKKRHATAVRRKEIADAARKLIEEGGSENITIRAIASKVGIAQSAIYRHFKSKKYIFLLVAEDVEKTILAYFSQIPAEGESALDALDILLRKHLLYVNKSRKGGYFLLKEFYRLHDIELNERIIEGSKNVMGRYKAFLSRGVESGEVREDLDLDALAILLFNMVNGLVNIWTMSNDTALVLEENYASMWNVFRNAVVKH